MGATPNHPMERTAVRRASTVCMPRTLSAGSVHALGDGPAFCSR